MNENIIEIKNLTKEYKMFNRKKDRLLETLIPSYNKHTVFKALDDFSLELKRGEALGILGRNGAREIYSFKNDYRCCYSN